MKRGTRLQRRKRLRRRSKRGSGTSAKTAISATAKPATCCAICGRAAWEEHHRLAKSLGGKDEPGNKVPVCRRCHVAYEAVMHQAASVSILRRGPVMENCRRLPRRLRPMLPPILLEELEKEER